MTPSDDKRYEVSLKITDKQMKVNKGEDEKVSFIEVADVSGQSPKEARLMAKYLACEIWSVGTYDIDVIECKEKEIGG